MEQANGSKIQVCYCTFFWRRDKAPHVGRTIFGGVGILRTYSQGGVSHQEKMEYNQGG